METDPNSIRHIAKYAEFYDLNIDELINNVPKEAFNFQKKLKVIRTPSNYLDLLTFKHRHIAKIVFDSPFTSSIYLLFNLINGNRTSYPPKELRKKYISKEKVRNN